MSPFDTRVRLSVSCATPALPSPPACYGPPGKRVKMDVEDPDAPKLSSAMRKPDPFDTTGSRPGSRAANRHITFGGGDADGLFDDVLEGGRAKPKKETKVFPKETKKGLKTGPGDVKMIDKVGWMGWGRDPAEDACRTTGMGNVVGCLTLCSLSTACCGVCTPHVREIRWGLSRIRLKLPIQHAHMFLPALAFRLSPPPVSTPECERPAPPGAAGPGKGQGGAAALQRAQPVTALAPHEPARAHTPRLGGGARAGAHHGPHR